MLESLRDPLIMVHARESRAKHAGDERRGEEEDVREFFLSCGPETTKKAGMTRTTRRGSGRGSHDEQSPSDGILVCSGESSRG